MSLRSPRVWFEAALFATALALALVAGLTADPDAANLWYFGAWTAALLLLFSLALRLPLRGRGRWRRIGLAAVVILAPAVALVANIALYRHDLELDATAEKRYTAPPQLVKLARGLDRDVSVTYFYNSQDAAAIVAKDVLANVARRSPHLQVRAYDLDKEFVAARAFGVRVYNSAVVQLEGRRTEVTNSVDLREIAYAIERVMKRELPTVCFVSGHGEPYDPNSHLHLGHRETLGGQDAPTIRAAAGGLDRLVLAISMIGYADRPLVLASIQDIPADCAVLADIGPRSAYAPEEVKLLRAFLARGGRLLLMYDPEFPVTAEAQAMLGEIGLHVGAGMVLDPTNHSGAEPDKVAVPYFSPHPITETIALTVFPGPRPIELLKHMPDAPATPLIRTSKDSFVRDVAGSFATLAAAQVGPLPPANRQSASGPRTLAVAMQGRWPGQGEKPFRLVLVGSAGFATNAFFPYASNGDLAVSMIRWLAGDTGAPKLRPMTYSLNEIRLSPQQMRATFLIVEILLPLSVMLFGMVVWRRRR